MGTSHESWLHLSGMPLAPSHFSDFVKDQSHFCACFGALVGDFWLLLPLPPLLWEGGRAREAVFWGAVMNGVDAIFNFPHLVCQTRLPSLPHSQLRRRRRSHKISTRRTSRSAVALKITGVTNQWSSVAMFTITVQCTYVPYFVELSIEN